MPAKRVSSALALTSARVEDLEMRFLMLWNAFDELCLQLDPSVRRFVHMDPALLRDVVANYYADLHVTKSFHGIGYADCHKRAAFTLKWIVRLRPIQLRQRRTPAPLALYILNEVFATRAALAFINIDPQKYTEGFFDAFVTMCHRRELDSEVLSALMYCLDQPSQRGMN